MIEAIATLGLGAAYVALVTSPAWFDRYCRFAASVINADYRKVGGIRFIKIGRLTVSFSVASAYRPIGGDHE